MVAWLCDRCDHVSTAPRHEITLDSLLPFASALSSVKMVRSTIIVRASDALPLAASVDDEQVGYYSIKLLRCHSSWRAFLTAPH